MKLNDLLKGINILSVNGDLNIDINNIAYDSRKVKENTLFICIKGFNSDGHKYIESAIEKGAKAFLVQEDINIEGYTFIKVEDTRASMANVADNFYNNPSKGLGVIGVTGTNGKTSITTFLSEILSSNNKKVGLVGTIKIFDGDKEVESSSTTPESIDLQKHFRTMIDNGCDYCAMEVSSHSLVLNRVDETEFKLGIFTNLTPEHLDFHKDLEDYRNAKEKLFYKTTTANIINIDDEHAQEIIDIATCDIETFGIKKQADIRATNIEYSKNLDSLGVKFVCETKNTAGNYYICSPGMFSIYNALAVIAVCKYLGVKKEITREALTEAKVCGRVEVLSVLPYATIIIDYAHNGVSLENILKTLEHYDHKRLICLFGSVGGRTKIRRKELGDVASRECDLSILTSDNPDFEDPLEIIDDIAKSFDKAKSKYIVEPDRKKAVQLAVRMAREGDMIVLAGKGHETYQLIKGVKVPFSEREIVKEEARKILESRKDEIMIAN